MIEISYIPFIELHCGDLVAMLKESYRGWDEFSKWVEQWDRYDAEVFDHPDTVGRCGFATKLGASLVGFMSWDPRSRPCVTIGHNCILPDYQNQGLGSKQLLKAIEEFRKQGFENVRVSTGKTDFFAPARKMYERCGFRACAPYQDNREYMVFYEIQLA
jgi:GNAT superfamily N-acetyltransferase